MTTAAFQEQETTPTVCEISIADLDQKLEHAIRENERAERLICEYLVEMNQREGHKEFGYSDIWDYAEFRFGFSERKTRYLMELGRKLKQLPQLRGAMADGRIGWTKASKVASVAKPEDEAMWLDSALSLSVRELDRKVEEQRDAAGVKIRAWLTQDQAAVFDNAVEVCRRMAGADLEIGHCLELISAEFLATYAYLAHQKEQHDDGEQVGTTSEAAAEDSNSEEESSAVEQRICPDNDDLPSPAVADYGKIWSEVLERDDYRCQYPDCGAREHLHVHHIEFRSRSGSKGRAESNSPPNLTTTCVFHHRLIHRGTIGVKGRAHRSSSGVGRR